MKNNKNPMLWKAFSKVVKIDKCSCGKSFKEPHWTIIFYCSDCNNNHGKTTQASPEKKPNHE